MSFEIESKKSQLFNEYDKIGGLWEVKDNKLVRTDIQSKSTEEIVHQSVHEGGVWSFKIGDHVFYNNGFGYIKAEVIERPASLQYKVRNEFGEEALVEEADLVNKPEGLF